MKDIREIYPDEDSGWFCIGDYQPLLKSFGYPILLQVDDDDYQGDSRLIFQDGSKYGLLIFGWGSCSGCDSLQGCNSYEEVDALRNGLLNDIKWFGSASSMLEYLNTHDWEGDYSWRDEKARQFVEEAKTLMEGLCKVS